MKTYKYETLLSRLAIILILAAAVILSIWRVSPPRVNENDPQFIQMMYNLERMATGVRWVGTPAVAYSRDQIIAEVESMGLTAIIHRSVFTVEDHHEARQIIAQVRQGIELDPFSSAIRGAYRSWIRRHFANHPLLHQDYMYVDNILVTLESSNPDAGSLMFVAHYDTTVNTPGAADAMLPVVAMLEAMRVHANNNNLASNVHFLFTDGEEWGALGAFAFSRDFPNMIEDVDLLINLEAMGNAGGLLLFETSSANLEMVRTFNRAVSRPIGFHWAHWIYDTVLPGFYTDFTIFREYGFSGLNFAIIGGREYYHTRNDTPENVNRDTAWHYLTTVLALSAYAQANDLAALRGANTDALFFTFLPIGGMFVMSTTAANVLTGLAFAVALAFLIYKFKTKMPNTGFIVMLLVALMASTATILFFASPVAYLLWIPLLAMSISAFLKGRDLYYKCAMTVSGVAVLFLWIPPIYLLLIFYQVI